MEQFPYTFRTAKQQHESEEIERVRAELIEKLLHLTRTAGHKGEAAYVKIVKQIRQDISSEELREKIKQYHDAVNERELLDRESP